MIADTILVLGVSGCIVLPVMKKISNKKIIVNIDGLEWKRNKWNRIAKRFLKYSEKLAVKSADYVIADNLGINKYIKDEYNKSSDTIAYGADHVERIELDRNSTDEYEFIRNAYAMTVCRIEPENNIHMILDAFSKIKSLPIVIVGNWNNSEYGKKLRAKYNSINYMFLLDPIYDQNRLNLVRSNCSIYIHGHSAGGTNPSLVEAMYLKLPIIVYDVIYNRMTTQNKALYFDSSKTLIELVAKLINNEKLLYEYSTEMGRIAEENYKWSKIAAQYANLFER